MSVSSTTGGIHGYLPRLVPQDPRTMEEMSDGMNLFVFQPTRCGGVAHLGYGSRG